MSLEKYHGVIPAFYACYDENNEVSPERCRALARYLVNKGVKGLYVGGSSGECIYLEKEERMATLEAVMAEIKGECTVIAHVGCNNTRESMQLAAHAESLGVDHRSVLERHLLRRAQHGFRDLQYSPAGGRGANPLPVHRNAEESQGHRREEFLHAHPGHRHLRAHRR